MRSILPFLLVLVGCELTFPADVGRADDPPDACTLATADGTEACPVDPCAGCASVAEGLACCVAAHGYGAPGEVTVEATSYCGTAETYDPSDYLGEATARCAAQVYGLPAGLGDCHATLVVCDGGARASWYVQSASQQWCGSATYEGLVVDAVNGRVEYGYTESVDGICDEED